MTTVFKRAPRPEVTAQAITPKNRLSFDKSRIRYDYLPYSAVKSLLKRFDSKCRVIGNCAMHDGIAFFIAKPIGNTYGVKFDPVICARILGPLMLQDEDADSIKAITQLPKGTNPIEVKPWHTH